jgi:hypothetical protein
MAGSKSTNNSSLNFQMQQADEAKQKEAARAVRLQQGQKAIDDIYNGAPVMGTRQKAFDWSSGALPSGWTEKDVGVMDPWGQPAMTSVPSSGSGPSNREGYGGGENNWLGAGYNGGGNSNSGWMNGQGYTVGQSQQPTQQSTPQMRKGYFDASGKEVHKGDPLQTTETYDTGARTGGFNDDFYGKYKQSVLDYYKPEVQRQYDNARSDLTFSLARTGNLNSSAAGQKQGALEYEKAIQDSNVINNADQQTSQLKSQVAGQKKSLIDQLYSTEDPTLAANLAQSSANGLQLQTPTLTPAAALFSPMLSAVGGAINSYTSPYGQGGGGSGITRPTTSSSSKAYGGQ